MKKICYISAFLGIEKRGIESYSLGLLKNIKKINPQLNITLVSGGIVNENFIDSNYIFPFKSKILKGIFGGNFINDRLAIFALSPSNIIQLIASISLIKYLLINSFDFYIPTNYFELSICKLVRLFKKSKSTIIFVGHAGPGHDDFKALLLQPDIFVELTEPSYDWAKKNSKGNTKVKLIPVGIDTDKFDYNKVNAAKNPFKNNNKIAIFVGAFVPYKRPELAIKLIEKRNDLNLIMIGQGPLFEDITQKYNYLVKDGRLFFTGTLDHILIPSFIKLADVSLMTSINRENSPAVLLEAMTLKKPVIATKYDRTEWMVKDGGILIDPENVDAFNKALNACFKNYVEYCNKAFTRSEYFSWFSVAKKWNNLLSK